MVFADPESRGMDFELFGISNYPCQVPVGHSVPDVHHVNCLGLVKSSDSTSCPPPHISHFFVNYLNKQKHLTSHVTTLVPGHPANYHAK